MHTYICLNCGAEKQAKYKSHIKTFCSHQCANEYHWKQKEKKIKACVCQQCGKEFEVKAFDYRLTHGGIKYCSRKCSGEASKRGEIVKCKYCGKEFYTTRHEFCSPECASHYKSENYNHKTYYENGYVVLHKKGYNKKGNAKQHRLVMEEHLGRRLSPDEVVHHINGIKTDNRIENLTVMSRQEHTKLHREMEKRETKNERFREYESSCANDS